MEAQDLGVRVEWTPDVEEMVKKLCPEQLDEIREEVIAGNDLALRYPDGSLFILRIVDSKKILFALAAEGARLKARIAPWLDWCESKGFKFILHSKRKGMGRFLEDLGFELEYSTYIYEPRSKENES